MKKIYKALLLILCMVPICLQCASASDLFYVSSDNFAYFIVENNGLMEMDLETGEALVYNEYIDIPSIVLAPDGDILINMRYTIIKTDLYENTSTIFTIENEIEYWIYHMKMFDDVLYVATTDEKIYSMQPDGSDCVQIADDAYLLDYAVLGTDLYYCDGTALYWIDLQNESAKAQIIVNDIVDAIEIFGDTVYFTLGADRVLCALESDGEYTPLPLQGIREFVILPDGERVAAIMRRDSSLRVFELNTGRECAVVAKDCFTVAVAADEKGFYYKVMEERSYIYTVYRINEDYSSTLIEEN